MMKRAIAIAATTLVLIAAAGGAAPAVSSADPVVPQPGTPCASNFAGAMTWLPDAKVPLECVNQTGVGYQWQTVATPYPISDRWLTFGPEMKLHGEGLRNSTIRSGDWIATPQESSAQCRAEQLAIIPGAVALSLPRIDEGAAGQPLPFQVVPRLFSIQMSGYCLWQKVNS